jgi:flagellar motor switch protein FliN
VSELKQTPAPQIEKVMVEISVLVGRSSLPMHQLLRMGRGAVIPLTATANDEVWVLVNNHPVARGDIILDDERITVQITDEANVFDYMAGP